MNGELFKEIKKLCEKHNTTIAEFYFELVVDDYISVCGDYDCDTITNDDISFVVNELLNDNEMWRNIENTVDYYLGKRLNGAIYD